MSAQGPVGAQEADPWKGEQGWRGGNFGAGCWAGRGGLGGRERLLLLGEGVKPTLSRGSHSHLCALGSGGVS